MHETIENKCKEDIRSYAKAITRIKDGITLESIDNRDDFFSSDGDREYYLSLYRETIPTMSNTINSPRHYHQSRPLR
jgi:hypothetical protein